MKSSIVSPHTTAGPGGRTDAATPLPSTARTDASVAGNTSTSAAPALICVSHLRWDFVFQRPQHLMTRFARHQRVFYLEEPVFGDGPARVAVVRREQGVLVVTPHLPPQPTEEATHALLRTLIDRLLTDQHITDHVLWFYTPMALPFTQHLRPRLVVYDCMDELSAFAGAPPVMRERESQLLAWADVVFTGGHSLHAVKRRQHPQVHVFPSSIDRAHFARARTLTTLPPDQAGIPRPRIGFYGVVDERLDIALLDGIARLRPRWQFVVIGPVVKIDPAILPRHANIHYLGRKSYDELPVYLAGWDVAMLPFARNEATRFISPTKTPEYLSAGRPVVSTPITDVVSPYGDLGLVHIAETPETFVAGIEAAFADPRRQRWHEGVERFLASTSWERTWRAMCDLMITAGTSKGHPRNAVVPV